MTDEELKQLVESNARAIQALIEQRATDRLEHQQRIDRMEDAISRLVRIEEAQNRMLASLDEDRPTVLRKLNTIENKIDRLLGDEYG